ncbi:Aspyridones cluster regulator apdR, partial [Dissostichus eleginoides]
CGTLRCDCGEWGLRHPTKQTNLGECHSVLESITNESSDVFAIEPSPSGVTRLTK